MKPLPLRYNISSWRQLPQCLSNTSRDLAIHVCDFFDNDKLHGFRISVDHPFFGTLFACVLNARGNIVMPENEDPFKQDFKTFELRTDQILKELRKYGFFITFHPRQHLSGNQIQYLMTLNGLKYDKIRTLVVWRPQLERKEYIRYIVAFNADKNPLWLDNSYDPSEKEFLKALENGSAINVTLMSETKEFNWDWLNYVASIDDIIRDNAGDGLYGC